MKQFTENDLYAIQECLDGYKVLLNWLPDLTDEEKDLKESKIRTIRFLMEKADDILEDMCDG